MQQALEVLQQSNTTPNTKALPRRLRVPGTSYGAADFSFIGTIEFAQSLTSCWIEGSNPAYCDLEVRSHAKRILVQVLENSRRTHAAANTHRNHSVAPIAAFQFTNHGCGQFGSGASERMPKRNCSAIRIHTPGIKPSFFDHRKRLCRESFVQFDHVQV